MELCTAGSSSGSTALVAAGAVPLAIGTDTAGSVRIPAACTGTIGFKPTFGLVPVEGIFPLAPSCDTVGFFALDIDLIRRAFQATRVEGGYPVADSDVRVPPGRPGSQSPPVPSDTAEVPSGSDVSSHQLLVAGDDSAAGRLLQSVIEESLRLYEILRKYEAFQIHRDFLAAQGDRYQPVVRQRALLGKDVTVAEYEDARAGQMELRQSALRLFDDADFIRTPAMDVPVPRWADLGPEHRDAFTRYSTPFNVLGWPAITVPVAGDGVSADGSLTSAGTADGMQLTVLPKSVQFAAAPGEDLALLAYAEEVLGRR